MYVDAPSAQVDLSQHLQSGIASLWDSKKHTDVTFSVEGTRVEAHRIILAAQSDHFDRLLFGEMREAHAGAVIPLQGVTARGFQVLIKVAYTGRIDIAAVNVRRLSYCQFVIRL